MSETMSKILEIQPGVLFVLSDWGSTLVPAYDTRTITASLGVDGTTDKEKEKEKEGRPSNQTASSS